LTLVCHSQAMLRGQFPELFMGKTHNYRIRIIINDGELCQPISSLWKAQPHPVNTASDYWKRNLANSHPYLAPLQIGQIHLAVKVELEL
jgi:hypothetical protein